MGPAGSGHLLVEHVPQPHRLEELTGALLILAHLGVPDRIKLLEFEPVRLLHTHTLRHLPRAQLLLTPAPLMLAELLEALSGDVCFDILALPHTVLLVLLQDHQELLHRRLLARLPLGVGTAIGHHRHLCAGPILQPSR